MRFACVHRVVLVAGLLGPICVIEAQVATQSVRQRANRVGKLKVALVPVDETQAARTTKPLIQAKFEEAMLRVGRFSVMTRMEMEALRAEQRLAASGAVDPASAVRLGKMLSVDYVVVARHLVFSEKEMSLASGLRSVLSSTVGRARTVFDVGIQVQAIDVETGEIVASSTFEDTVSGAGTAMVTTQQGTAKSTAPPRPQPPLATPRGVEAYRNALERFGDSFARQLAASIPLQAVVVLVRDVNNIAINLGVDAGLAVGTKFEVVSEGEAITDPSGAVLGYDDRVIGQAEVVRVEEQLTWLKLLSTVSPTGVRDPSPDVGKVTRNMGVRTSRAVP